jgi:23S rRNA pseudouridine1911/1915/1917 synthase
MTEDRLFHVEPHAARETLSAALRRWLPGMSWKEVRELIERRRVTVSGNLCLDPARRLQAGEAVKVTALPQRPPPKEADVEILFADEHVAVVNKPSGMTTIRHPEERAWPDRRRQLQPTLDEILPRVLARYEGKRLVGEPPRLRAVHRIDRDTSGLLVFARTVEAERALGAQFRAHTVHRRYLAIAVGRVEARTVESRLVLNRGDGRRGSTPLPEGGQRAVTHVRPVEYLKGFTLVECRLETGRTHQIRIHHSEAGCPVAGDKVYNRPLGGLPIADASLAPRLALHAAELGFEHPSNNDHRRFFAPLPDDLQAVLARLRKRQDEVS